MFKLFGIAFISTAALFAQDNLERTAVPLHDPSRPARIMAQLLNGGITVHGADVKEVTVEARGRSDREGRERSPRADGMRRLELPGNAGLDIVEEDNVVHVRTASPNLNVDLVITVPRRSSLQLKSVNNGDITVDQVDGEIDVDDLNGKINLKNVSGSVVAHSLNGSVTVSLDRIDLAKPMSFSTLNGDIDVTIPDTLKANVVMKTDSGEIFSDFDVKLTTQSNMTSKKESDGSYRVHFDRALRGTINGGGPEFQFTSFNGQIYLRKKK
jgi:Putative adhesin